MAASEKEPFRNDFLLLVVIIEDDDANLSGMLAKANRNSLQIRSKRSFEWFDCNNVTRLGLWLKINELI